MEDMFNNTTNIEVVLPRIAILGWVGWEQPKNLCEKLLA
jgi:hypothetical protein